MASAHHKNSVADLWLAVIYELEIASRSRLAIIALTYGNVGCQKRVAETEIAKGRRGGCPVRGLFRGHLLNSNSPTFKRKEKGIQMQSTFRKQILQTLVMPI